MKLSDLPDDSEIRSMMRSLKFRDVDEITLAMIDHEIQFAKEQPALRGDIPALDDLRHLVELEEEERRK